MQEKEKAIQHCCLILLVDAENVFGMILFSEMLSPSKIIRRREKVTDKFRTVSEITTMEEEMRNWGINLF